MKKLLLPALIVVIAVQLSVPVYSIFNRYDILKTGEEFRFRVAPVDPYDAFRGRYVSLNVEQGRHGLGRYGIIAIDSEGFAIISSITDTKPASGAYVKNSAREWFRLPIDRYYMDENLAPLAQELTRKPDIAEKTYVTVRLKKGEMVISGLFIDDIAIEDIIRNNSN